MANVHEILQHIPHERIQSQYVRAEEQFDVFKLGVFRVARSLVDKISSKQRSNKLVDEIVELVELQPNSIYKPHYHLNSAAVIYIVLGEGDLILGDARMPYQPGQRFTIPNNEPHGFFTRTRTLFLSIQSPPIRNRVTGVVDLHYV